jgi:hypothetical protein
MPLASMSANHVAAAQGQFEMQRASNALLYIIGLNSAVQGAGQGTGIKDDVLTLSLATFALPKVTMTPVEVGYLNEKRKFVGRPTFDDLQVVFNDFVDVGTAALLQKWWYLCYNPENGFIGLAAQYKKSGMIRLNGPNGQFDREYELVGCFPSQFDMGEIDMLGEDGVKITMTLSYDKYIPRTGLNPAGNI